MTFSKPWLGTKRVAFVPLFRTNATPPDEIPPDWENVILRRVINDPRPEAGGVDRSLRAWLRAVSWGRADIDPIVLPMQTIDKQAVPADELEETLGADLRAQGAKSAILIMLGGAGFGTTSGFWSRVVMDDKNGTWLHEIFHAITNFKDLYDFGDDIDPPERKIGLFDVMSAGQQAHPTAFTKNEFGWLDDRAIGRYQIGSGLRGFILHPVGSLQPPVHAGEVFAVRIGIGDDVPYVMVEARLKTDHFETGISMQEPGIPKDGVIVYRVQTPNPTVQVREGCRKPLFLMTLDGMKKPTALQPGESMMIDNGVRLKVVQTIPKGFIIHLTTESFEPEPIVHVTVPSVIGMNHKPAEQAMVGAGLCSRFSGPLKDTIVISQSPEGGSVVQWGSSVTIEMGTLVTTPDVLSMRAFSARRAIERVGLRPNQVGPSTNSIVATQSPEGGTVVPGGSTVTFHMERTDL